ncbi:MAG: DUF975 family protein [Clostridia bacterium]|nr:DUF975 family protein [Clostridia bacterium]
MIRSEIKERAKRNFRANYWLLVGIFAVALLLGAIQGGTPTFSFNVNNFINLDGVSSSIGEDGTFSLPEMIEGVKGDVFDFKAEWNNAIDDFQAEIPGDRDELFAATATGAVAVFLAIFIFAAGIGVALGAFVIGPIGVGANRVATRAYDGGSFSFGELFWAFRSGFYMRIVGVCALNAIFTILPIIIFTFAGAVLTLVFRNPLFMLVMVASLIVLLPVGIGLSLTTYLVGDPAGAQGGDSAMEVIRTSWEIMRGHKWERFVFGLSFIGWQILSGLTLGILGIFYVNPYREVAFGGYYRELSLNKGLVVLPEA